MSDENQPLLISESNIDVGIKDATTSIAGATINLADSTATGITECMNYLVLETVFAINLTKIRAKMAIRKWRSTNLFVNAVCTICECVGRLIVKVAEFLIYAKTEPECYSWIGMYEYGNQRTKDTYFLFKDELQDCVLSDFQDIFCGKYRDFCENEDADDEPVERVLFAQVCPEIVRVKNAQTADPEKDIASIQPADFSFFSINYYAGDFGPVSIDIPKSHYMVGNELLSVGYVLRYLEYLPLYKTWHFNETYVLRIIDENMNTFELNEKQWIVLTESGYDICKKFEPASFDDLSTDDLSTDDLSTTSDSSDEDVSTSDSSDEDASTSDSSVEDVSKVESSYEDVSKVDLSTEDLSTEDLSTEDSLATGISTDYFMDDYFNIYDEYAVESMIAFFPFKTKID